MQDLIGRQLQFTAAKLDNWQRVFCRGLASIKPKNNAYTIGLLYAVTKEDIQKLNRYEGYNPSNPSTENLYNLKPLARNTLLVRNGRDGAYNVKIDYKVMYYVINEQHKNYTTNFEIPSKQTIDHILLTLKSARKNNINKLYQLDIYNIDDVNNIQEMMIFQYRNNGFERIYYIFGYGSLHSKNVQNRIGSSTVLTGIPARLDNWQRCFHGWSTTRQCSPANIKQKNSESVVGLLYQLNEQQLNKIRQSEGYQGQGNTRNMYDEMIITKNKIVQKNIISEDIFIRQQTKDFTSKFPYPVYTYVLNEKKERSKEFNFENVRFNEHLDKIALKSREYIQEVAKLIEETKVPEERYSGIVLPVYDFHLQHKITYDLGYNTRLNKWEVLAIIN
jgi:gamma-glutamylcyclotransferase (GGCT)/AIG2-like uncharacterized protein YtfP